MTKIYHRGTLSQFNTWNDAAKVLEGIPPGGRIGYVNGVPAPQNQRTTDCSEAKPHPTNSSNDYIWLFGAYQNESLTKLTRQEAIDLGWEV